MRAFQKLVNQKVEAEPSVAQFFTNVGSGSRSASSRASSSVFSNRAKQRDPIEQCLLRLQKSINTIPGLYRGHNAAAGFANQCRRDQPDSGPVRLHHQRYRSAGSLRRCGSVDAEAAHIQRIRPPSRSDFYSSTPNLDINIDRERAAIYGVSTSAIQSLLQKAYSQNYVYLIKQPDDQYQVILEVKTTSVPSPGDLNNLYVRSNRHDKRRQQRTFPSAR